MLKETKFNLANSIKFDNEREIYKFDDELLRLEFSNYFAIDLLKEEIKN